MKYLEVILLLFCCVSGIAQNKNNGVEQQKVIAVSTSNDEAIQALLGDYESVQLPPLSTFLQSAYEHPSIQIYEASRDEQHANYSVEKAKWLNYFRLTASYQYGRIASLASQSTFEDPISLSSYASNQSTYFVGAVLSIPLGDLVGQKPKVRAQRARLRRIEYEYEISIEERKLKILEAYNKVVSQLAVLKAKSDAAALYNAQMKISEQDFINGKITIIELSLERGRRSSAVVTYQEGRANLHNSITLLEMLTNVKIMNR